MDERALFERVALVTAGVAVGFAFRHREGKNEKEAVDGQVALHAVRRFLKAQDDRDLEAICACVADDVVYINEPMDEKRWIKNKDQFRQAFAGSPCIWAEDAKLEVIQIAVVEDTVFVERLDQFFIKGKWLKIPICGYLKVRDGKIYFWKDYWDYVSIYIS